MMSPIVFFCLLVGSSALQCNLYAQSLLGSAEELNIPRFQSAQKMVGNETGVLKTHECKEGELCVGDAYIFTNPQGKRAGFVWTSCWATSEDDAGKCYWEFTETDDYFWKGKYSQYRCVCNKDNCQKKNHLFEQFEWAFSDILQ